MIFHCRDVYNLFCLSMGIQPILNRLLRYTTCLNTEGAVILLSDIENTGRRPGLGQKDNEFSFTHIKSEVPVVALCAMSSLELNLQV